ncbi:MAG TPA: SpoIIE family protein phosphatase [Bacteroidia bacterium]|nr:SpoIIE family protein phosphatase [Bacteroidia bacterium]
MNPFKSFRNYFIGDALSKTDDVFEKVKIDVLFNFTLFFLLLNIPYVIIALTMDFFHEIFGITQLLGFSLILVILRKTSNVKLAIYFYIANHTIQNLAHYFINNGRVEAPGVLFFLLYVMFGFLMLDKKWGWSLLAGVGALYIVGTYNITHHFVLFHIPDQYADPENTQGQSYFTFAPILMNIYLVAEFVRARGKAEKQIQEQKILLQKNNTELEFQKKEITSSINYAKRIQSAILPLEDVIYRGIPLSFIFYRPRDIVSGDFYWFHEIDRDNYIIVCGDCTGHGVPGALMTVIGSNLLTQIVTEGKNTNPSSILSELDRRITSTLKQQKIHDQIIQDGMDLALLKVDKSKHEFILTAAKRPAIFIRNKELQELKGNKHSLGGLMADEKKFEAIKMNYEENDMIYLFTDGIIDQFGGEKNKKFTIRRFRELILNVHRDPMPEQKNKIENEIVKWIGTNEQTDDILVIGIRF